MRDFKGLCEGDIEIFGFAVFAINIRPVFQFWCQKTLVFQFWYSLQFADFSLFSIWFSVFVKNTSGFSVLVSDAGFGFSYMYFALFGFQFLFDLSGVGPLHDPVIWHSINYTQV